MSQNSSDCTHSVTHSPSQLSFKVFPRAKRDPTEAQKIPSVPSVQEPTGTAQREAHASQKANSLPSEVLYTWKSCIPSTAMNPSSCTSHASQAEPEYTPSGPSHTLPIEQGGITLEQLKMTMIEDAKAQEEVIPIICEMLEETVRWNDKARRSPVLQAFEGETVPTSVASYVKRILKYSRCSIPALVVGLIYLERIKRQLRNVRLTSSNIQRILLVSTMVAAKYLDDFYYSNWHWAQIGGITMQEINDLELDFLFELTFDVGITPEEYKYFILGMIDVDDKNIDGLLSYVSDSQAHIVSRERGGSLKSLLAEARLASKLEHATPKDPQAKATQRKLSISELDSKSRRNDCDECCEASLVGVEWDKLTPKDVEHFQKAHKKKEIVVGILGRNKSRIHNKSF